MAGKAEGAAAERAAANDTARDRGCVAEEIERIRGEWGKRLLVLGHHYQSSRVLRHVDAVGDSLELSRRAAAAKDAERIAFCGVHFMAESADLLKAPGQTVYMPVMTAGCPMADMADAGDVERAWAVLREAAGDWLPVVYVNSTAAVKAFCGRNGGSTCTSSNAARVLRWVYEQGKRPFFLPDEHLGANTAHDLGIPDGAVAVYDPRRPDGGLGAAALAGARLVAWKGFCIVHVAFTAEQVRAVRQQRPEAKIIVHPESPREVVRLADAHGSTSRIIEYVRAAPAGSTIVVGTELHLIERLAGEERGRVTVLALRPSVCANMARTREEDLLDLLREWPERNAVRVPRDIAADARAALERMLRL
jgi:quinolinate synthase